MVKPIITMAGLAGTGKTTLSKQLNKKLINYKIVSYLGIQKFLGHKRFRHKEGRRVVDTLYQKVEHLICNNKNVLIDYSQRRSYKRKIFYQLAKKYQIPILIIECYCSEEEAKRRIRKRREQNKKNKSDNLIHDSSSVKMYERMKLSWEKIEEDYKNKRIPLLSHLKVDTEKNKIYELKISNQAKPFIKEVEEILEDYFKNSKIKR